jgi:hypothetical protein
LAHTNTREAEGSNPFGFFIVLKRSDVMAQPEHPDHPHEGGPPGRNPERIPPGQQDKPEKPDEETEPEPPPPDPDAPHPEHPIVYPPEVEHHEGDEPDKEPV